MCTLPVELVIHREWNPCCGL